MKVYLYNGKLVEEIGGAYDPVVFLNVLKDEDKNCCPHCKKPVPTEYTVVVSSPDYRNNTSPVETLK